MNPTIRAADCDDVPAVLALWRHAEAAPTHTDDDGSLVALVRHDPAALIVAEDDGLVVGSVIAAWDGWRGSIYRLVVAPEHRRAGLGRRLLSVAEERLVAVGAARSQAVVVASDPRALGFWRSSGWEEQVERARFVRG
ncbi:MAG: GNAT family N-acetyltransferase [Acidimicrobiales bacterium]|jgi:ribosomal protein S18 acetylase RimI-like enzyme